MSVCMYAIPVHMTSLFPSPLLSVATICHAVARLQSSVMVWFLLDSFRMMMT